MERTALIRLRTMGHHLLTTLPGEISGRDRHLLLFRRTASMDGFTVQVRLTHGLRLRRTVTATGDSRNLPRSDADTKFPVDSAGVERPVLTKPGTLDATGYRLRGTGRRADGESRVSERAKLEH